MCGLFAASQVAGCRGYFAAVVRGGTGSASAEANSLYTVRPRVPVSLECLIFSHFRMHAVMIRVTHTVYIIHITIICCFCVIIINRLTMICCIMIISSNILLTIFMVISAMILIMNYCPLDSIIIFSLHNFHTYILSSLNH